MIQELISCSGVACRGGFIAYYHEMSLYCPDPALMFSKAIGILVSADGRFLITPVDLTHPEELVPWPHFRRIPRTEFSSRATGALFYEGRYFAIKSGDLMGAYQISDDLVLNERFPNPKAYRRFLLQK